ncbi:transposase [Streptomyces sp. NPDC018352]|uniref:transposase n=1 Tax=Streptomyces sp. NPDC018352 TaxID=3157194 RepID=UPI0033FAC50C
MRGDLTGTQWAGLEPLLPGDKKLGQPPIWSRRQLIDGTRFRTCAGVPWRDARERYGPWPGCTTCYLFCRWQRMAPGSGSSPNCRPIPTPRTSSPWTSTSTQRSAGPTSTPPERGKGDLQVEPPGGVSAEPDDHNLGRLHGGPTTKGHLAVEQRQSQCRSRLPLGSAVTFRSSSRSWTRSACPHGFGPSADPARPGRHRQSVRLPK